MPSIIQLEGEWHKILQMNTGVQNVKFTIFFLMYSALFPIFLEGPGSDILGCRLLKYIHKNTIIHICMSYMYHK